MNKKLAIALLSLGLLSANAARADDAVLGALIGGGAGVLIGHSLGGRNGSIIGGALGAAAGAAMASDHSRARVAYMPPPPPVVYAAPQPVIYAAPRPVYVAAPYGPPPMVVETMPVRYGYAEHRHWDHRRW